MDADDRSNEFIGTTVIDLDLDSNNIQTNNDIPGWLRDVLDRALTASGLKSKKKVASHDAIKSLKHLNLYELKDKDCPICFDPYEVISETTNVGNLQIMSPAKYEELSSLSKKLSENIQKNQRVGIPSLENNCSFNDPSLFFPIDEVASVYYRFPTRKLSTLEEVTQEDELLEFTDEEPSKDKNDKSDKASHIPVQMPNCKHIFGKSCIIEWLNNNVSCPLCRKEVEASENNPEREKRSRIENSTFSNYNDRESTIEYLTTHSTDIFNPFRRPYNRSITPLTDSFIDQEWTNPQGSNTSTNSREPSLVLPRRFPFPETTSHFISVPMMTMRNVREPPRNPNNNNSNNNNTRTERQDRVFRGASDTLNRSNISSRSGSPSGANSNSGGGPERSRRNNTGTGRVHPYSRPQSED